MSLPFIQAHEPDRGAARELPVPTGAFEIDAGEAGGSGIRLSLVIPTFNERGNLRALVQRLTGLLDGIMEGAYELIVVDDDSADGTWDEVRRLMVETPQLRGMRRVGERGLATAVIRGWQAARGEILGVIDADLQHPPEILLSLLGGLERGADLAIASRHVAGGGAGSFSWHRRVLSRGAQLVGLLLLPGVLGRVSDPMSGFFLVRRASLAGARMRPLGYKILLEVLGRGRVRQIEEVGYVFGERASGESKVSLRLYLEYLRHLLRLRPLGASVLLASLLLHLGVCAWLSSQKPLWLDELFTLYVAELPDAASIWSALRGGMDNHPPASYLLSHYAMALVGHTPFGLRLPSMLAVWAGLVALYRFVAARATPEAGAGAVLLVASSAAFPYAWEARGYGLMFGAACFTLRAWQRCLEPDRGRAAAFLLFLSVSATLWTHYYALLVLAPLALAEAVRAVDRRAVDGPVALALLGGALNVLPLYWLATQASVGFSHHFWAKPGSPAMIVHAYETLLGELWLPAGAVLVLLVVLWSRARRGATLRPLPAGAARWELWAALGFLAILGVMWVLAKLVTHAYHYRYGLPTIIGAAVLFGRASALVGQRAARLAVAALVALLPVPLLKEYAGWHRTRTAQEARSAWATSLAETSGMPVVFDEEAAFLPIQHQAGSASRFFVLTDADAELRLRDHDTFARAFEGVQRYRDLHARALGAFVAAHRRFLLVTNPSSGHVGILPRLLEEPGARVELVSLDRQRSAHLVTLPERGDELGSR